MANQISPKLSLIRDERGIGLLFTVMVMAMTVVLGLGLVTSGMTELDISSNYRSSSTAFYAADSGLEQTLADLRSDTSWIAPMIDNQTWTMRNPFPATVTINSMSIVPSFVSGTLVNQYYPLGTKRDISSYGAYSREVMLPPTLTVAGGDVFVSFPVRSTGGGGVADDGTALVRADVVLEIGGHGVWDNAIFADKGNAGNLINGHVAVRGSVHVIGDENNPPNVEFSGTGDIRNNYDDANWWFNGLETKMPALVPSEHNGEWVETLDSEIRLRHGQITLNGAADIGQSDQTGNAIKETVDAIRADGTVGPAADVHADEWAGYDAHALDFPTLDDPYTDPNTGIWWPTHRTFLENTSMTVNISEISDDVGDFSYSDLLGNSISWDQSSLELTITGIVRIDGDVRFGKAHGKPNRRGVNYQGTGTFFATDDIHVDGYLVPVDDYITDGNMGLIADDDIVIDQASQNKIFAAIYGEDQITVSKQTAIAGAMVSSYFDMGQNVPAIFHVPDLATNLPPGMPGSGRINVIKGGDIRNWYQEIGQ